MPRWLSHFTKATAYSFVVGHAWGYDLNGLAAGNTRAGAALLAEHFPDDQAPGRAERVQGEALQLRSAA
ncbi:MAG: hypothetical protein ACYC4L_18585 [Chloroflexota bacterium]